MKGFALVDPLSCLLGTSDVSKSLSYDSKLLSYDSKPLSYDTWSDHRLRRGTSSKSDWREYGSNSSLSYLLSMEN